MMPPFDHPAVIAGQATLAMELLQQDVHLDRILYLLAAAVLIAGLLY